MRCPVCDDKLVFIEIKSNLYAYVCENCDGKWFRIKNYDKWIRTIKDLEDKLIKDVEDNFGDTIRHMQNSKYEDLQDIKDFVLSGNFISDFRKDTQKTKNAFKGTDYDISTSTRTGYANKYAIDGVFACDEGFVETEITGKSIDIEKVKACPECNRILIKYKVSEKLNFHVENCGYCGGTWLDTNKWEILNERQLVDRLYEMFTSQWQTKVREGETKNYFKKKYSRQFGSFDYERIKDVREWIDDNENKTELLNYLLKSNPYRIG